MNISSALSGMVSGHGVSIKQQAACCLALPPAAVDKGSFE